MSTTGGKRSRWLWISLIVSLVAGGAVGAKFWHGGKKQIVYQTGSVTKGDLRLLILSTGSVAPENRIDLKPPVAGRIEKVLVQEGNKVHAGQILAWMSSTERATLIDTAKSKGPEELKYWQDAYKMTPILAPSRGLIILKNSDTGQSVTQTDIVLSMSDRLIVKANVDETDLAQIKVGQAAETVLDAFDKQPLESKVVHIGYDAKTVNNVTTYEVDVLVDKIPEFMKSGMTANVTFVVDERKNVLTVPAAAVKREKHKNFVLVPNPEGGGEPLRKEIEVGLNDGKKFEVTSGLSDGDAVLVASVQSLGKGGERGAGSPFTPNGPAPRR
jgi:macrolide-specific efflux system membrane fusion protein